MAEQRVGLNCKATCPGDRTHNRFVAVVVETSEWVITQWGQEVERIATNHGIVQHPSQFAWLCHECGAEAVVVDCDEDGPDIGPDP